MAESKVEEHRKTYEIEKLAVDSAVLHLLRCTECATKVLQFVGVLENTPLSEYPPAD